MAVQIGLLLLHQTPDGLFNLVLPAFGKGGFFRGRNSGRLGGFQLLHCQVPVRGQDADEYGQGQGRKNQQAQGEREPGARIRARPAGCQVQESNPDNLGCKLLRKVFRIGVFLFRAAAQLFGHHKDGRYEAGQERHCQKAP